MEERYRGESWWVSPFNFIHDVLSKLNLPDKVLLHDVTLRDGEQTPGIVFNKQDKIDIAKALDEIGINRIEAGMPVISQEEKETIRAITDYGLNSKIFTLSRLLKNDIDSSINVEVDGIVLEAPLGVPKLMQFENWTLEYVKNLTLEMIDYAKSQGIYVVFFGVDTTRADPSSYFEFIREINRSKADSIAIVDTFGCITVEGMKFLVKKVKGMINKPIEIHVHNDFGLAVATTLAAITEGAEVAHVAVNGIGERTGNAALEEVVSALKFLYGININVKFENLYKLSKLVEERSKFKISLNKPIVGEYAFGRESGISVAGWMKFQLGSEPILPHVVGNSHKVILGKKSGRNSIKWKLINLGIDPDKVGEDNISKILEAVKEKSQIEKRSITDKEFMEIISSIIYKK